MEMGILATCPSCGFPSAEVRCPRCNALKVVGCGGACSACKSGCDDSACGVPAVGAPKATRPSTADAGGRSVEEATTVEPLAGDER